MVNKVVRFSKALRNESAKRVPIILILLVTLLLWQNYANGQKANATLIKIDKQSEQIKHLSEDNKNLAKQNNDLQRQLNVKTDNINNHVDCIVALFLPNKLPPTTKDVEDCRATYAVESPSSNKPAASTAKEPSSPQPTPNQPTPQSNNSQGNNPPKGPDCTIDILFLHAGRCQ